MRKLFSKIGKPQSSLKRTFLKEAFELTEDLGGGPIGNVRLAQQKENTSVKYAVKIIKLNSKAAYKQLKNDIKYLSTCKNEHLVSVHCCFEKSLDIHIVTDYMVNGSLHDMMTILQKPFDESVIAHVMAVLCETLVYLHGKHIIHGDIRGSNLMVNHHQVVKVTDYGLSAKVIQSLARATMLTTPYWKAPEHISSDSESYAADMWALGITAIELAEGKPPLAHLPPIKALFEIPNREPPTVKRGTDEFRDFLASVLIHDPSKRATPGALLTHPFITKHVTLPITLAAQQRVFTPLLEAIKKRQRAYASPSFHALRSLVAELPAIDQLNEKMKKIEQDEKEAEASIKSAYSFKRKALLLALMQATH